MRTVSNLLLNEMRTCRVWVVLLVAFSCGCAQRSRQSVLPVMEQGTLGLYARVLTDETLWSDVTADPVRRILVSRVDPGGPAEKAGIQAGDVLLSIDGHALRSATDALDLVKNARVGRVLAVKIGRDGETLSRSVTVGRQSAHPVTYRRPQEMPDLENRSGVEKARVEP